MNWKNQWDKDNIPSIINIYTLYKIQKNAVSLLVVQEITLSSLPPPRGPQKAYKSMGDPSLHPEDPGQACETISNASLHPEEPSGHTGAPVTTPSIWRNPGGTVRPQCFSRDPTECTPWTSGSDGWKSLNPQ